MTGLMFEGFTQSDFEAYLPRKWKSNVFNRERLEVKQKLLALGRDLAGALTAADGSPLDAEASVEHPALWNHKQVEAQHLYFYRNEGARRELDSILDRERPIKSLLEDPSPHRNHLLLAVTLDKDHLEVALKLHPAAKVDRQNLQRRVADHWQMERLLELLRSLPDGITLGTSDGEARSPGSLRGDDVQALLRRLDEPEPLGTRPRWLTVGRTLLRDEVEALGAAVSDTIRETLVGLLPLYQFIAWSRDNDYVSMRQVLDQKKQTRRQRGLARSDRVRIVRGMFAGQTGTIQEVDAKGGLKVLVGKMAVRVDADDVERK